MIGHPFSDEKLLAFAAGGLEGAEAYAIGLHAGSCARCAAKVKRYQAIRDLVRSDDGVDPPPAVLARAGALMSQDARLRVQPYPAAGQRRRLLLATAALVLLLFVFGLFQGVQGAAAATDSSLPGDGFYPLKTLLENIRLAVVSDAGEQVQLRLELVQTRLSEIQKLAAQKRYADLESASAGLQFQLDETTKSLDVLAARDPERAARSAALALQSFAQASLALRAVLSEVPVSQQTTIEHAVTHSDASASIVRERMISATSTPVTALATATSTSEAASTTPTNTGTPQPTPTPTPSAWTATPSATPVPAVAVDTPPGQAKTPPGQVNTPPGQAKTPPGQVKTPPGQEKTPPGQVKTPPGQAKTPPGHK